MLIKEIQRGNRTLRHTRLPDSMGFLRDNFQIELLAADGMRTIYPFRPPPKVNKYKSSDPIKFTNDYTDEEYELMFNGTKII